MADYISALDGPSMDDALTQMNQRLPEQWTTGQIDGVDVPSGNPRYHNNAKWYSEQAQDSISHQPIIQNEKWYVWNPITSQYEDSGVKAHGVKVSNIKYQEGSSATTIPTGTWQDNPVSVAQGKYLWTRITFDDGTVSYTVARQGADGSDGEDGFSPTFSSSKSGKITTVVITDAQGQHPFEIKDGEDGTATNLGLKVKNGKLCCVWQEA